jgi:hypothetical protein
MVFLNSRVFDLRGGVQSQALGVNIVELEFPLEDDNKYSRGVILAGGVS